MNAELALVAGLHDRPDDATTWFALADWYEEQADALRAELLRTWLAVRSDATPPRERERGEDRLRHLMRAGARPFAPTVVDSLGQRLVLLPPGTFWRGSSADETDRFDDEGPRRHIRLSRAFYLGATAVTQARYATVMGRNPSHFRKGGPGRLEVADEDTGDLPVDSVGWSDAAEFCARLSARAEERAAGRVYRLPTEAEWEYACRGAGTSSSPFWFGHQVTADLVNHDARYPYHGPRGEYRERPVPVGTFPPNVLGLYEMHGNVWEWCSDWFDGAYYADSPALDPPGPPGPPDGQDSEESHVLRGGSWYSTGRVCRTACRNAAANRSTRGFRVAMTVSR